jgi:hypothetical protein
MLLPSALAGMPTAVAFFSLPPAAAGSEGSSAAVISSTAAAAGVAERAVGWVDGAAEATEPESSAEASSA